MKYSLLNYVPYLLSCRTCLVCHMLSCLTYSRVQSALCPTCSRSLRALASQVPRVLCVLILPMRSVSCALFPICPHDLWAYFSNVPLVPRTFNTLCANISFFTLEFTCLTLLFFPIPLVTFVWESLLKLRQCSLSVILWTYWRSAISSVWKTSKCWKMRY